jgi:thiamine-phosphate pyrophosphorylase
MSFMDPRLLAWARAVKARRRSALPVLWLFTDAVRLPDPLAAIACLPRGLCGVVFRPEGVADRAGLAREVGRLCRARGIALTVAGDWRLAASLGVGVHLRGGRGRPVARRLNTSSAHGVAELRRARLAGALAFLSPVFPTPSHPGAAVLGPWRWGALARGRAVGALGGMDAAKLRRLPRGACIAVGAISALGGTQAALAARASAAREAC